MLTPLDGVGIIGTDELAAGAVTRAKLASDALPATSYVATSEATASTTFVPLATAQAVTLTTGTAVRVSFGYIPDGSFSVDMSVEVSGATAIAANLIFPGATANATSRRTTWTSVLSVTAGVNTFTALFRSLSGVSHAVAQRIMVVERLN